jgi:adenosylcobinamide-GDP ribazoletransferase
MAAGLRRTLDGAVFAITFLTILPLRVRDEPDAGGTAPAWYPLVGAAVGAVAGGIFAVAEPGLGASVAAIAAVGTLVVLTGGLHQDGLADCADGMGVRGNLERRLAVMRDPAIGSFGTLALVLWALLLTASLAQLSRGDAVAALVTSAAVGRWSALLHARWAPPARKDGLGSAFAPSTLAVVVAGLTAVTVAAIADVASAAAVAGTGVLVAAAISVWSRRALGGRTGDTLGAAVALTEVVVILVLLTFARHS